MLRLHLQPKLKIKLATHDWTRGKMVILLKYIRNTRWKENYRKQSSNLNSELSNYEEASYL